MSPAAGPVSDVVSGSRAVIPRLAWPVVRQRELREHVHAGVSTGIG